MATFFNLSGAFPFSSAQTEGRLPLGFGKSLKNLNESYHIVYMTSVCTLFCAPVG